MSLWPPMEFWGGHLYISEKKQGLIAPERIGGSHHWWSLPCLRSEASVLKIQVMFSAGDLNNWTSSINAEFENPSVICRSLRVSEVCSSLPNLKIQVMFAAASAHRHIGTLIGTLLYSFLGFFRCLTLFFTICAYVPINPKNIIYWKINFFLCLFLIYEK